MDTMIIIDLVYEARYLVKYTRNNFEVTGSSTPENLGELLGGGRCFASTLRNLG